MIASFRSRPSAGHDPEATVNMVQEAATVTLSPPEKPPEECRAVAKPEAPPADAADEPLVWLATSLAVLALAASALISVLAAELLRHPH